MNEFARAEEQRAFRKAQIQASRAGVVSKRRKSMRRNTSKYAIRPAGWRDWLAALLDRRQKKRRDAVVIPAHLRPWVPKNRAILAVQGEDAARLVRELRAVCGSWQFETIALHWLP